MFLQNEIEERLWSTVPKLKKTTSGAGHVRVLSPILKEYGCKFRLQKTINKKWTIRGSYFLNNSDILIVLGCTNLKKKHNIRNCSRFLFNLNCTIQHELIHRYQWELRNPDLHESKKYRSENPHQEYLNNFDEIETQAHDLAMEIKYFYPSMDPKEVLTKYFSSDAIYLPTLNTYMKIFNGDVSKPAMQRLFRKLFVWLPLIEVKRTANG